MKTTKRIEKKARHIVELINELRDDVIKAQDSNIADVYRGYIMGTELDVTDRYLTFAKQLKDERDEREAIQESYSHEN